MRLRYSTVAGSGLLSQHSTLEVGGPIRVPMVWFLKLAIHNTYLYIYMYTYTYMFGSLRDNNRPHQRLSKRGR